MTLLLQAIQLELQSKAYHFHGLISAIDTQVSNGGKYIYDENYERCLNSLGDRSVAHEVSDIIGFCASSDNPIKIIQFLESYLESLQLIIFDNEGSIMEWAYSKQFFKVGMIMGLGTLVAKLNSPFLMSSHMHSSSKAIYSNNEMDCMELLGLEPLVKLRRLFGSIMVWVCKYFNDLSMLKYAHNGSMLQTTLQPFISLLSCPMNPLVVVKPISEIPTQILPPRASGNIIGEEFPVMLAFLEEFYLAWSAATAAPSTRLGMLRCLNTILDHALLIYFKSKFKENLFELLSEILTDYLSADSSPSQEDQMETEIVEIIKDLGISMLRELSPNRIT